MLAEASNRDAEGHGPERDCDEAPSDVTTDDFILLVKAQLERGLIIPDGIPALSLRDGGASAVAAGLCTCSGYYISSGTAKCYSLTREGWLRYGELTNANILFPAP